MNYETYIAIASSVLVFSNLFCLYCIYCDEWVECGSCFIDKTLFSLICIALVNGVFLALDIGIRLQLFSGLVVTNPYDYYMEYFIVVKKLFKTGGVFMFERFLEHPFGYVMFWALILFGIRYFIKSFRGK